MAPPECTDGQFLVDVVRTCGNFGREESFQIYEGASDYTQSPVYQQSVCSAGTFYFCMNPMQHTIVLRDSAHDGWDRESSLMLKSGGMTLSYTLNGIQIAFLFNLTPTEAPTTLPPTTAAPTETPTTLPLPTTQIPECEEGKLLLEVIRVCGTHPNEESFELYEGARPYTSGILYNQTICVAGTHYMCINALPHTIELHDIGIDGWNGVSYVTMKSGNMSVTYTLTAGGKYAYYTFDLTPTEAPTTAAPTEALPTTVAPTTLPPTTAAPTETPTTLPPPTQQIPECEEGKLLLEVIRVCGTHPNEESFEIYEGARPYTSGILYNQTVCMIGTHYMCINALPHTIELHDLGTDGWNGVSYVTMKSGYMSVTYTLSAGGRYAHFISWR